MYLTESVIGFKMAFKTDAIMLVIFSLVIGSVFEEFLKIEDRLENLGKQIEIKFAKTGNRIAKGFVVSSLVYCVGLKAIIGSMERRLTGNHQTLFAKSALDGLTSIIFTSTFAIGFNMLEIKIIRVGNMLPAIFIPLIYYIETACELFLTSKVCASWSNQANVSYDSSG